MTEQKQYIIENITDILQVPKDSFADFIVDLTNFYNFRFENNIIPNRIIWTDDKRHDITIKIISNGKN